MSSEVRSGNYFEQLLTKLSEDTYRDHRPIIDPLPSRPELSAVTAKQLRRLGQFPDSPRMAASLARAGTNDAGHAWKYSLSGFYSDGYDLLAMSEALCPHPDDFLKELLWGLARQYFPETQVLRLHSYFLAEHPETGYKEDELLVFFAIYEFLQAPDARAIELAEALDLDLAFARKRDALQTIAARFELEKTAVDRLERDIRAHMVKQGQKPKWRDYINIS